MPIAAQSDNIQFEFKTKSDCVDNLLSVEPKNAIVSWSLNPQEIISKEEPFTASLDRRLNAALNCVKHGYKVGFHFDPLIMTENFETIYGRLFEMLTDTIPQEAVEFISISTFRCPQELLDCIRSRKAPSVILKGDFIKGLDGKARYFKGLRAKMLRFAVKSLRKQWKNAFIYFCMEHESLWKNLLETDPGCREDFEKSFPYYR